MTEKDISESLFRWLEPYGVIKWHKNSNHSFYLKFKDVRLGSIRISNHKGRERYSYTYELYRNDKNLEKKMKDVISGVINKSKTLKDFDPENYIVWDRKNRKYKKVNSLKEYKQLILNK